MPASANRSHATAAVSHGLLTARHLFLDYPNSEKWEKPGEL